MITYGTYSADTDVTYNAKYMITHVTTLTLKLLKLRLITILRLTPHASGGSRP